MSITFEKAERLLEDVPTDQAFYLKDGTPIRNLVELGNVLHTIDTQTFKFYTTKGRNDFALWVKNVVGDTDLGRQISALSDKTKTRRLVDKRIKDLHKVVHNYHQERLKELEKAKKTVASTKSKSTKAVHDITNASLSAVEDQIAALTQKVDLLFDQERGIAQSHFESSDTAESEKFNDSSSEEPVDLDDGEAGDLISEALSGKPSTSEEEILIREKAIEKREEKIMEAEERIETMLSGTMPKQGFFSKSFWEGLIMGILLSAIAVAIAFQFLR